MEFGRTAKSFRRQLLVIFLLFSVSTVPSIASQTESQPEWKYVTTLEDDNQVWKTYYDLKSIKRRAEGTVEVWLKQTPITKTEKEHQRVIDSIIQNRKLNRMPTDGYGVFAYSLTLIEFDCSKKLGRSVSIKDFDKADKLLGSDTLPKQIPFAPVVEGSMVGIILEAVCN